MRLLFLITLPLLALAQAPFPIMTQTVNSAQKSAISSSVSAYVTSIATQPAYTSASNEMYTATVFPEALTAFENANGNPILLAQDFLTATATPAWYTQCPNGVQNYVSSVAAAEATIVKNVIGSAGRSWGGINVGAMLAGTGLVVVMLL